MFVPLSLPTFSPTLLLSQTISSIFLSTLSQTSAKRIVNSTARFMRFWLVYRWVVIPFVFYLEKNRYQFVWFINFFNQLRTCSKRWVVSIIVCAGFFKWLHMAPAPGVIFCRRPLLILVFLAAVSFDVTQRCLKETFSRGGVA